MNSEELPLRLARAIEQTESDIGREFTEDEKFAFSSGYWAGAEMANNYSIKTIATVVERFKREKK